MDDSLGDRSSHTHSLSATRRRLLRAGGGLAPVSMTGFAGCVGGSPSPEDSEDSEDSDHPPSPEDFDRCNHMLIRISSLPEYVHNEVQTALDEGVYEAEELYIKHLMDVETSYLQEIGFTYYRAHVTEMSDGYRLELEEATPSIGISDFGVINVTDVEQTVTVHFEPDQPRDNAQPSSPIITKNRQKISVGSDRILKSLLVC